MNATNSDTSHPGAKSRPSIRKLTLGALTGLVGLLLVASLALWGAANSAYQRSFSRSLSLAERTASAQQASDFAPWDRRYATRATVMRKWLHGSILLSQDAALPATQELGDAYRLDIGDQELLALYKKAQQQLSIDSNYKAHIQHAHEATGGVLQPGDLLR